MEKEPSQLQSLFAYRPRMTLLADVVHSLDRYQRQAAQPKPAVLAHHSLDQLREQMDRSRNYDKIGSSEGWVRAYVQWRTKVIRVEIDNAANLSTTIWGVELARELSLDDDEKIADDAQKYADMIAAFLRTYWHITEWPADAHHRQAFCKKVCRESIVLPNEWRNA